MIGGKGSNVGVLFSFLPFPEAIYVFIILYHLIALHHFLFAV